MQLELCWIRRRHRLRLRRDLRETRRSSERTRVYVTAPFLWGDCRVPGFAPKVPARLPGSVCQPANRSDHGADGVGHVDEVDGAEFVAGLVVVLVESEAGDGLGDDALERKGVVVGAAEEMLSGVGIVDQMSAVLCQL